MLRGYYYQVITMKESANSVTFPVSSETPPSEIVLEAVTALTEESMLDIDPLYGAVDPDALDELFGQWEAGDRSGRVSFRYADCQVTVGGGKVRVEKRGRGRRR